VATTTSTQVRPSLGIYLRYNLARSCYRLPRERFSASTHYCLLDAPKLAVLKMAFCDAFSLKPIKADVAIH
jgi:hypothetical protein